MSKRPTIAYQPALDGVRALAVAAVLLFHGEVPGFDGGYLGVSVFFTLSGFLITSLLVREHDGRGRIDLAAFYTRRLRRLLPASALCLIAVVVLARTTEVFEGVESLRDHVLGSVFQVANWVLLAGEGSYQDLLARTRGSVSPLEHFWSLAIEEQFYWIWPPTMALVLSRAASRRSRIRVVGAISAVALLAAPVIAQVWGPDAAYWATPARIGEILVGGFVAVVLADRGVPARWHALAPLALVALGAAVVLFPPASGPAYEGALPLVALVSAALLVGLQAPGPVRDALAWRPLVWLGRISYGVYVFHWPVYVILDGDRTGLDGVALLALRLAVTLAISQLSFQLMESPIRHAARIPTRVTFAVSGLTTAVVAAAALLVVPTGLGEYWLADEAASAAAAIEVDDAPLSPLAAGSTSAAPSTTLATPSPPAVTAPLTTAPPTAPPATSSTTSPSTTTVPASSRLVPLPPLSRPVRIVVAGDSTANALGSGVVAWAAAHPELAQAEIVPAPGCGFVVGGEQLLGDVVTSTEACDGWTSDVLFPTVTELQPDVVMVMVTSWDLVDRRWDTEEMLAPPDAPYRERIAADYRSVVTGLLAAGAGHVALVRQVIPNPWWMEQVDDQEDPSRHQVIYDTYDELARTDPAHVSVVTLDEWFAESGLEQDIEARPDGVHVTPETATEIAEEFLGDRLIRSALGLPTR